MGKGDKKTRRGKIILGSFGVRRPHKPQALAPVATISKKAEKVKPEKTKTVKHTEASTEVISEPIVTPEEVLGKSEMDEKKIVKPKAPKKATAKSDESSGKPAKPGETASSESDKSNVKHVK